MGLFDMFKREARPTALEVKAEAGTVLAPATGTLIPLSSVSDEMFKSGVMGSGCGVKPSEGTVYAPVSGTLVAAGAPNYHALCLVGDDGAEILIHVGVDTVKMHGDGFKAYAEKGTRVEAGQPILGFSPKKIRAAGFDDVVIMAVTNSGDYSSVTLDHEGAVRAGEVALRLVP